MHIDAKLIINSIYSGGRKPFVIRSNEKLSYSRLSHSISSCLKVFDCAGLISQDRVMIVTFDEDAAVAAFLAATLDGKVPTIISPETPHSGLKAMASHYDPKWIFADEEKPSWATTSSGSSVATDITKKIKLFVRGQNQRQPIGTVSPRDTAYVMFTSGSTANPKAVSITHAALAAQLGELAMLFAYEAESRIFNGLMLSHADGLIQGPVLAAAVNASWLRPPVFTPAGVESWLNMVSGMGATHFISVPTVYELIDRLSLDNDYFESPKLKMLQSVGAKLSFDLRNRIENRFGKPVANHYGLTETVVSALYNVPGSTCSGKGDVGKGIAVEAKLQTAIKDTNNEIGELLLRGPQVFSGYWRADELTSAVLINGWLRTGDLAKTEDDGTITIIGRIKTSINTGGLLVFPDEIDEVLLTHPAVSEAATIGVPDDVHGEIAISAVVLASGVKEYDLAAHCMDKLEPLKVPKHIVAVNSIPRGDIGKPKISELGEILQSHLSNELSLIHI